MGTTSMTTGATPALTTADTERLHAAVAQALAKAAPSDTTDTPDVEALIARVVAEITSTSARAGHDPDGAVEMAAEVWRALAEQWRKTIKAKGLSLLTEERYLATAYRWAAWLEKKQLAIEPRQARARHLDDFHSEIRETSSASNAAHHYRNLRVFFGWLAKTKEIKARKNPFLETSPPAVQDKITPLLEDEHHAALLLTCNDKSLQSLRDRAIILLFIDTGMRVSEMHSLRVDQIDLKQRQLVIVGKGGKVRVVRYGNSTALALARYLKVRARHALADSPALWLSRSKVKPLSVHGIQTMLSRRGERAGVPGSVHPHRFRHDFSDRWQSAGGTETGLMEIAGWSSAKMPRHYGKAGRRRRALAEHERIGPADALKTA
jgi:site-specific recombinase XerC